jgi:peptidoglycan hydrolase-like protein with peptidoglycan-binding domain
MKKCLPCLFCLLALSIAITASADELGQMAQQDLVTLGYDPGNTDGNVTTQTVIAISKFQAEHDMAVTGEVSPQLIGALRAAINKQNQPAGGATKVAATPAPMTPEQQAADLQARQQACLQQKYAAAQASRKKKRGFGRLLSAVARTGGQLGGSSVSRDVYRRTSDIYNANATAQDLSAAAKDLGLTEDDVEQCRNPS